MEVKKKKLTVPHVSGFGHAVTREHVDAPVQRRIAERSGQRRAAEYEEKNKIFSIFIIWIQDS